MKKNVGTKAKVWHGTKDSTAGGMKKGDLTLNKFGRIVSKKSSARAKKTYQKLGLVRWTKAVQQARKTLGIKGFQVVGGK